MNVFDFDNTIYDGDSTVDFWKYCMKRFPKTKKHLAHTAVNGIKFAFGIINKTEFKEDFYRFLGEINDIDSVLCDFWDVHEEKIKDWYLNMIPNGVCALKTAASRTPDESFAYPLAQWLLNHV